MKLILCAGTRHLEGYKTHDVKAYDKTDYVCDLFDINNHVKEGSCDEVQFTHALEHFPTAETQKVLMLLKGLLKDGGLLYIEVPNFEFHADLVLNHNEDRKAVYYAFGGQLDQWDFHKTGFTPKIIKEELEIAGFKNIDISGFDSLTIRCIK
jgi:hypothetical protein